MSSIFFTNISLWRMIHSLVMQFTMEDFLKSKHRIDLPFHLISSPIKWSAKWSTSVYKALKAATLQVPQPKQYQEQYGEQTIFQVCFFGPSFCCNCLLVPPFVSPSLSHTQFHFVTHWFKLVCNLYSHGIVEGAGSRGKGKTPVSWDDRLQQCVRRISLALR